MNTSHTVSKAYTKVCSNNYKTQLKYSVLHSHLNAINSFYTLIYKTTAAALHRSSGMYGSLDQISDFGL